MTKTPQKMRVTFELYGSDAKKRTMYKWFRALEKSGHISAEMEALFEVQTAFQTPEELAALYKMKPEDFEETG